MVKIFELNVENIISEIANKHNLKVSDLKGRSRKKHIFSARKEAIKKIRENTDLNLSEIGRVFGRDHSSIVNALKDD